MLNLFLINIAALLLASGGYAQPVAKSWEQSLEEREEGFKSLEQKAKTAEKELELRFQQALLQIAGGDRQKADALYESLARQEAEIRQDIEARNRDKEFFRQGEKFQQEFLEKRRVGDSEVLRLKSAEELFEALKKKDLPNYEELKRKFSDWAKREHKKKQQIDAALSGTGEAPNQGKASSREGSSRNEDPFKERPKLRSSDSKKEPLSEEDGFPAWMFILAAAFLFIAFFLWISKRKGS